MLGPIHRTFEPAELIPHLASAGVGRTVLVQVMDSYADLQAPGAISIYPLVAPRVRPEMNCLCSSWKMMRVGSATSREPAASRL